jgi:hypothetical protein
MPPPLSPMTEQMQFNWLDLGAIAVITSLIAAVITYVIRLESKELKIQIKYLQTRVDKVEKVLERLADQKEEVAILHERQMAHGKRQDVADERANAMAKTMLDMQTYLIQGGRNTSHPAE